MVTAEGTGWQIDWEKRCVVFGRSVLNRGECCHVRVHGEMVALCTPSCFDILAQTPKRFLRLRRVRHLRH